MNKKEILGRKLKVSSILFTNNVPVNEAKIIGTFIEDFEKENTNFKQALNEIKEVIKHSKGIDFQKLKAITEIIDKVGGKDENIK